MTTVADLLTILEHTAMLAVDSAQCTVRLFNIWNKPYE